MTGAHSYPLVIRNRSALLVRAFMTIFLALVLSAAWTEYSQEPRPSDWQTLAVLAFLATAGLTGLIAALGTETCELRITGPRDVHVSRGAAFSRHHLRLQTARLWIEDTEDSDGGDYYKLMLEAPGGPLCIAEGHRRSALVDKERQIRSATGWS